MAALVDIQNTGVRVSMKEGGETREEGESPRVTRQYLIEGVTDSSDAYAAILSFIDKKSGGTNCLFGIPLSNVTLTQVEYCNAYDCEVQFEFSTETSSSGYDSSSSDYGDSSGGSGGSGGGGSDEYPEIEDDAYQFNVTPGTAHVTHSIRTLGAVSAEGFPLQNFGGGVNLNDSGVFEGVDVYRPLVSYSISVSRPRSFFNSAYRRIIAKATCTINAGYFDGYAPGCVLFKGVNARPVWYTYSQDKYTFKDYYWRLEYQFEAAPATRHYFDGTSKVEPSASGDSSSDDGTAAQQTTDASSSAETTTDASSSAETTTETETAEEETPSGAYLYKRGFDYVWRLMAQTEGNDGAINSIISQINVEQMYYEFDFNLLGLRFPE